MMVSWLSRLWNPSTWYPRDGYPYNPEFSQDRFFRNESDQLNTQGPPSSPFLRSRKPPASLWDPGLRDLQFQIQNLSWCPAVPGLPFSSDAFSPWYPRDGSRNCKGSQIPWILKSHSQLSVLAASTSKDSASLGWWTQYRIWAWLNPWMGRGGCCCIFIHTYFCPGVSIHSYRLTPPSLRWAQILRSFSPPAMEKTYPWSPPRRTSQAPSLWVLMWIQTLQSLRTFFLFDNLPLALVLGLLNNGIVWEVFEKY